MESRKRRSSILKTQKSRAPLSDIELNSPTSTEVTSKSRRVSFSHKKDVAEFVADEATTAWKNFYEEHNNHTLEISENDSLLHGAKKSNPKLTENQLNRLSALQHDMSNFKELNITERIALIDNDKENTNVKFCNSHRMSVTNSTISAPLLSCGNSSTNIDVTGRIEIDFSLVSHPSSARVEDEEIVRLLDEIKGGKSADVQQNREFPSDEEMLKRLARDYGVAYADSKVDNKSDMSITEPLQSPVKVDSINSSLKQMSMLLSEIDKENVAINPTRKVGTTAVQQDKILVFDGEKLQYEGLSKTNSKEEVLSMQRVLNVASHDTFMTCSDQSIVQGVQSITSLGKVDSGHGILPGGSSHRVVMSEDSIKTVTSEKGLFFGVGPGLQDKSELANKTNETTAFDDKEMSITQAIIKTITEAKHANKLCYDVDSLERRNSGLLGDSRIDNLRIIEDASKAKALLDKYIESQIHLKKIHDEQRARELGETEKTIYYDEQQNISMTNVVSKSVLQDKAVTNNLATEKTICFENEAQDISITQAVSQRVLQDVDKTSSSLRSIPKGIEPEKTICFTSEQQDISMTQAIPKNILLTEDRPIDAQKTMIFDDKDGDLSLTRAIPQNICNDTETNEVKDIKSVIYDEYDVEMTKAVAVVLDVNKENCSENVVHNKSESVFTSNDKTNSKESLKTVILPARSLVTSQSNFDQHSGDANSESVSSLSLNPETSKKSKEEIYSTNECMDMSITNALQNAATSSEKSLNCHKENEPRRVDSYQINAETSKSLTCANERKYDGRKTMCFTDDCADLSMTQAIPQNVFIANKSEMIADMSMTKAVPQKILHQPNDHYHHTRYFDNNEGEISMTAALPSRKTTHDEYTHQYMQKTFRCEDMQMTQAVPQQLLLKNDQHQGTKYFEDENDDLSMTNALPAKVARHDSISYNDMPLKAKQNREVCERRKHRRHCNGGSPDKCCRAYEFDPVKATENIAVYSDSYNSNSPLTFTDLVRINCMKKMNEANESCGNYKNINVFNQPLMLQESLDKGNDKVYQFSKYCSEMTGHQSMGSSNYSHSHMCSHHERVDHSHSKSLPHHTFEIMDQNGQQFKANWFDGHRHTPNTAEQSGHCHHENYYSTEAVKNSYNMSHQYQSDQQKKYVNEVTNTPLPPNVFEVSRQNIRNENAKPSSTQCLHRKDSAFLSCKDSESFDYDNRNSWEVFQQKDIVKSPQKDNEDLKVTPPAPPPPLPNLAEFQKNLSPKCPSNSTLPKQNSFTNKLNIFKVEDAKKSVKYRYNASGKKTPIDGKSLFDQIQEKLATFRQKAMSDESLGELSHESSPIKIPDIYKQDKNTTRSNVSTRNKDGNSPSKMPKALASVINDSLTEKTFEVELKHVKTQNEPKPVQISPKSLDKTIKYTPPKSTISSISSTSSKKSSDRGRKLKEDLTEPKKIPSLVNVQRKTVKDLRRLFDDANLTEGEELDQIVIDESECGTPTSADANIDTNEPTVEEEIKPVQMESKPVQVDPEIGAKPAEIEAKPLQIESFTQPADDIVERVTDDMASEVKSTDLLILSNVQDMVSTTSGTSAADDANILAKENDLPSVNWHKNGGSKLTLTSAINLDNQTDVPGTSKSNVTSDNSNISIGEYVNQVYPKCLSRDVPMKPESKKKLEKISAIAVAKVQPSISLKAEIEKYLEITRSQLNETLKDNDMIISPKKSPINERVLNESQQSQDKRKSKNENFESDSPAPARASGGSKNRTYVIDSKDESLGRVLAVNSINGISPIDEAIQKALDHMKKYGSLELVKVNPDTSKSSPKKEQKSPEVHIEHSRSQSPGRKVRFHTDNKVDGGKWPSADDTCENIADISANVLNVTNASDHTLCSPRSQVKFIYLGADNTNAFNKDNTQAFNSSLKCRSLPRVERCSYDPREERCKEMRNTVESIRREDQKSKGKSLNLRINDPNAVKVSEIDLKEDVVTEIDALPFIGNACSWEAMVGDTWSFRLLRSRLRVVFTFQDVRDSRCDVTRDSVVREMAIEGRVDESTQPLGYLTCKLAVARLSHAKVRVSCRRARHVAAALSTVVHHTELCLAWAKRMHQGRLVYAYSLDKDGILQFNFTSLVIFETWLVRLRIVLEPHDGSIFPRATDVTVTSPRGQLAAEDIERVCKGVPLGWDNVLTTVKLVTKYLKQEGWKAPIKDAPKAKPSKQ